MKKLALAMMMMGLVFAGGVTSHNYYALTQNYLTITPDYGNKSYMMQATANFWVNYMSNPPTWGFWVVTGQMQEMPFTIPYGKSINIWAPNTTNLSVLEYVR